MSHAKLDITGGTLLLSKPPSAEVILEIATELGVAPSFIEKDWYAVQVLKLISGYSIDGITPIFSGGTSLSKGYGLIQRFSEDIDFKLKSDTSKSRSEYKKYRAVIIKLIQSQDSFSIDESSIKSQDGSRFFSCDIAYPQTQILDSSLRANLKLEMRFQHIPLATENREIKSFVAQFKEGDAETSIECVSPAETAADKFSALLWRVVTRDDDELKNDPTMIRHLHDLCALEKIALTHEGFIPTIHSAFESDKGRGGMSKDMSLNDAAQKTLNDLRNHKAYERNYRNFVDAMSYATFDDRITFRAALKAFENIISAVTK